MRLLAFHSETGLDLREASWTTYSCDASDTFNHWYYDRAIRILQHHLFVYKRPAPQSSTLSRGTQAAPLISTS